jgi:hypothetical protein
MTALVLSLLMAAAPAPGAGSTLQRRFALLVGANDGGAARVRLRYAGSDAQSMDRVLRELGGVAEADRSLLLDPDRAAFVAALGRLRDAAAAARALGQATEILIYYSGHSDEQGLLLRGERVSYGELRDALNSAPADVRIAILDSCASGELTRAKGGVQRPAFLVDSANQVKGHAFLTSSSADEVAQESDRLGSSFFTHALVSGLRGGADSTGDGRVTLTEAYQFAFRETLARTERTEGGAQHPAYDIQLAGSGDVVMTDLRGTSAGLAVARDIDGRLYVRDAARQLVVELNKVAGHPIELALEPGIYQVTLERQGKLSSAQLTLVDGKRAQLDWSALSVIPGEATVSRGEGQYRIVPFNLALWKGLDLNGQGKVTDRFSFAPLVGGSTRLDGFAFAGIGSFIDEDASGVQVAGVINVEGGTLHGIDFAGVINRARRVDWGAQIAGVGNVSAEPSSGLALAGAVNLAQGGWKGLLLSGAVNYAAALSGAQVSLVNVGGTVNGAQLGLVNVASHATAQVGLVNLGEDVDAAVGLVSISRDTSFHFEASGGDLAPGNVGLQIRGKRLYSTFSIGVDPFRSPALFYTYAGIGLHSARGGWWFEQELGLANGYVTTHWDNSGVIPRLRFNLGYAWNEHLSAFAGVALNLLIQPPQSVFPDVGYGLELSGGSTLTHLHLWPAPYAGVRF